MRQTLPFLLCTIAWLPWTGCGDDGPDFAGTMTVSSLELPAGASKRIAAGSVITVTGEDTIDGTLNIDAGGATLIFENNVTFNGTLNGSNSTRALRTDGMTEPDDITIEARGNLTTGDNFQLTTDTSLKITDNRETLPDNDAIDMDVDSDDGGNVLAPFGDPPPDEPPSLIPTDLRQARPLWGFSGPFRVIRPPAGIRRIVVAIQPGNVDVAFQNLSITGPDGLSPTAKTEAGTCTGDNGGNAMTFVARLTGDLTVNNFTLNLGNGGDGQDCTATGTPDATATGGSGGRNGKMKMRTTGSFTIAGAFTINPGRAGHGGDATANALDGQDDCPPTPGGTAVANGGNGGDKKKVLRTRGVSGLGNLTIGDLTAGDGGQATARAGHGGDNTCPCPPPGEGEDGGDATAQGGDGGDASLTSSGVTTSEVIGGDGGDANASDGQGGRGNHCGKHPGGDGGFGGDIAANAGDGGDGTTNGSAGTGSLGANSGRGGDGGDGVQPGEGGFGGTCTIDGDSDDCPDGDPGTLRDDLLQLLCLDLFDIMQPLIPAGQFQQAPFPPPTSPPLSAPLTSPEGDLLGNVPLHIEPVDEGGGFQRSSDEDPMPHIALQNAAIQVELEQLSLTGTPQPDLRGFEVHGSTFGDFFACNTLQVTPFFGSPPMPGNPVDFPIQTQMDNTFVVDSFFDVFTEVASSGPPTALTMHGVLFEEGTTTNCLLPLFQVYIIDP